MMPMLSLKFQRKVKFGEASLRLLGQWVLHKAMRLNEIN